MITTQTKTSVSHTEAFIFAFLHFKTQFILMKFEVLCHFNHTLMKLYHYLHTLPADHQRFTVNSEHEGWFSSPHLHMSLPYFPAQKIKNDIQQSNASRDYIPTKHFQWKPKRTGTKTGTHSSAPISSCQYQKLSKLFTRKEKVCLEVHTTYLIRRKNIEVVMNNWKWPFQIAEWKASSP